MVFGSRTILTFAALLAFSACSSSGETGDSARDTLEVAKQEATPDQSQNLRAFCPKTVIRDGTELFRTYANGVVSTDPGARDSLNFQATITDTARECNYSVNNLNIRVGVRGRAINGPTGATGTFTAPVRVAVATVGREVLYSQLHNVQITIPDNGANAQFSFVDDQVNIPVPERPNLIIFVGFDEGPPS